MLFRSVIETEPNFDVVEGFTWSYDLESYAGGSVALGRVSFAERAKSDDPTEKRYPGPPV